MSSWIAITGGCGYVGSHIAAEIRRTTQHKLLIIDRRAAQLPHAAVLADEIVPHDYSSGAAFQALTKLRPWTVIHCAANSLVGPSVTDPQPYYQNNVVNLMRLLDHLRSEQLDKLIFSSSSSVYGECDHDANREDQLPDPINPYGRTKMIGEIMIRDWCWAYGLSAVSFRYFNAVGAGLGLGQEPGATHIIARIIESQIRGEPFTIYGTDYPTADGTCVRDYVHVTDIARAHVMGMAWLIENTGYHVYNLGGGGGYSVREIIAAVESVTGKPVQVQEGPRRFGDRARTQADITAVARDLRWAPIKDLRDIVSDAACWYNSDTYKTLV